MAEVIVRRTTRPWSKWNATKLVVEATLDRAGLSAALAAPVETSDGLSYRASRPLCDAVALALEGLGLTVEVLDASGA